ncbi:hypothetical protein EVAR_27625_1 [Eumeta japonica]|uniref:Uncharacterized protein n=1 Tax=Eumeta variegata TaxID=151549 RepID=A0A4C1V0E0_EUMVA|nr:hypothetical protein EVAR_27625_1 [Eumeta japonica]
MRAVANGCGGRRRGLAGGAAGRGRGGNPPESRYRPWGPPPRGDAPPGGRPKGPGERVGRRSAVHAKDFSPIVRDARTYPARGASAGGSFTMEMESFRFCSRCDRCAGRGRYKYVPNGVLREQLPMYMEFLKPPL